jgi:cell division septation protein DedD
MSQNHEDDDRLDGRDEDEDEAQPGLSPRTVLIAAGLLATFGAGAWLSISLLEPDPEPPTTLVVDAKRPLDAPSAVPAPVVAPVVSQPSADAATASSEPGTPVPAPAEPPSDSTVSLASPASGSMSRQAGGAGDPPPPGATEATPETVPETTPAAPSVAAAPPAGEQDAAPANPSPSAAPAAPSQQPSLPPSAEAPAAGPAPMRRPDPPPQVAARPPADAVQPGQPGPEARGGYTVQVGTFSRPENAERLAQSLVRDGFEAFLTDWTDAEGRTWRAVRVGRSASEADAQVLAERLSGSRGLPVAVLRLR